MKNQKQTTYVTINGRTVEVVNFVPENSRTQAIVDLNILRKLASLLPSARISDIKSALIEKLANHISMQEYIDILENEVAFHKSVNLINEYKEETSSSSFVKDDETVHADHD